MLTFLSCRDDPRSEQVDEVVKHVVSANRRAGLCVEHVDVDADPARVVELGVLECPALVLAHDGAERGRLTGPTSRRAILHLVLPELHHDPDVALTELRRQLDSPGEQFPRRVLKRRERIGKAARVAMLARVPLLASLTKRALSRLSTAATEVVLDGGSVLVREGEPGEGCWMVATGSLSVTRGKHALATLGPGDVVGEMALLDGGPRTATVTADERCVLVALDRAPFQATVQGTPDLAIAMLEEMSRRLRSADAQLAD